MLVQGRQLHVSLKSFQFGTALLGIFERLCRYRVLSVLCIVPGCNAFLAHRQRMFLDLSLPEFTLFNFFKLLLTLIGI